MLHGLLPERAVPFIVSDGGLLPNGPELIVLLLCFWQPPTRPQLLTVYSHGVASVSANCTVNQDGQLV